MIAVTGGRTIPLSPGRAEYEMKSLSENVMTANHGEHADRFRYSVHSMDMIKIKERWHHMIHIRFEYLI